MIPSIFYQDSGATGSGRIAGFCGDVDPAGGSLAGAASRSLLRTSFSAAKYEQ